MIGLFVVLGAIAIGAVLTALVGIHDAGSVSKWWAGDFSDFEAKQTSRQG